MASGTSSSKQQGPEFQLTQETSRITRRVPKNGRSHFAMTHDYHYRLCCPRGDTCCNAHEIVGANTASQGEESRARIGSLSQPPVQNQVKNLQRSRSGGRTQQTPPYPGKDRSQGQLLSRLPSPRSRAPKELHPMVYSPPQQRDRCLQLRHPPSVEACGGRP